MTISGFQLALASLVLSLVVWGLAMRSIFKMRVSREPRGFQFVMLVSTALAAVALFHRPGFAGATGIAPTRGVLRPLAVPTTVLVDKDGVVRWIDQTDDYRMRSDADRVLAAVRNNLV